MDGCDTFLMIGSNFPFADWLPEPGQARGVQIDVDGRNVGLRYPMELNLVGDAGHTLRALPPPPRAAPGVPASRATGGPVVARAGREVGGGGLARARGTGAAAGQADQPD